MNNVRSTKIYLFLIILVAAALLIAGAAQKSFWTDEVGTIKRAHQILTDFQFNQLLWNHFLVDISMGLWGSIWGFTELGLRSLSIIWALAALILTYLLARDLLGDRVALIAVSILGLSPLFLLFAHNARYYSLAATLSLFGALGIYRSQSTGRKLYLLMYLFGVMLLVLTMYQAVIVIVVLNLWWFVQWLGKPPRARKDLWFWLLTNLLVGLIFVLGIQQIRVVGSFYEFQEQVAWISETLKRSAFLVFSFSVGETISPLNPVAWLGLLLVAGVGVFALVANRRKLAFWLPVLFVLSTVLANLLMSFTNPWLSTIWQALPHWSFYALPFFSIWLAAGFAKLKPKISIVALAMLCIVYGVGIVNYFSGRQFVQPLFTVPWRTIIEQIEAEASTEDFVVCSGGDVACDYYLSRYGFENRFPKLDGYSDDELPRIWLIRSNITNIAALADSERFQLIVDELTDRYPSIEVV